MHPEVKEFREFVAGRLDWDEYCKLNKEVKRSKKNENASKDVKKQVQTSLPLHFKGKVEQQGHKDG